MKKLTLFFLIIVILTGNIYAQNWGNRQPGINPITIEGALTLQRGGFAVECDGTIYFVPCLNQYFSFIGELREGATVYVEGFELRNRIHPTRITIDGRPYDFAALSQRHHQWNTGHHGRGRGHHAPRRNFCGWNCFWDWPS